MRFLRRLFGLDFPDPEAGQVWRSHHSGRAVRVHSVRRSDSGRQWHIALQHEDDGGFIPIAMDYCMFPSQWRRMLRDEARQLMGGGSIEPSRPWPRGGNVNPAPRYPKPPAPQRPPRVSPPHPTPVAIIHVDGSFVHVEWHVTPPENCHLAVYAAPPLGVGGNDGR